MECTLAIQNNYKLSQTFCTAHLLKILLRTFRAFLLGRFVGVLHFYKNSPPPQEDLGDFDIFLPQNEHDIILVNKRVFFYGALVVFLPGDFVSKVPAN